MPHSKPTKLRESHDKALSPLLQGPSDQPPRPAPLGSLPLGAGQVALFVPEYLVTRLKALERGLVSWGPLGLGDGQARAPLSLPGRRWTFPAPLAFQAACPETTSGPLPLPGPGGRRGDRTPGRSAVSAVAAGFQLVLEPSFQ